MPPRHINRKNRYNRILVILATLIIVVSTWSILCSHVFLGKNNVRHDSLHLLSPDRLQSENIKPKERSAPQKPNSQIYIPPPPTNSSRRYLTYTRHGGRLNNQMIQFIGAIQHARVLKRKLIVPDEVEAVEWTGLLDENFDIWDLSSLKSEYDLDWELGLSVHKERAEKEGVLPSQIPKGCTLNKVQLRELLNGGPEHWKEWDVKCPDILSLGKELPLCRPKHSFCGDAEALTEAYKVYKHLKLSPFMQSLLPPPQPLSVHSRRAGEGGYDWEICTDPTKTVCTEHMERKDWNKYCNERTLRGNCAIWTDLSYAIKSKSIWKADENQYRFNLASDGTHDWSIDFKGQYVTANSTPWLIHMDEVVEDRLNKQRKTLQSLGRSFFIRERLKNTKDMLSKCQGIMFQLSSTILEMFSLVNSEYFVGGFYSTLSLNVCLLRGLDRLNDSNMCWMLIHPHTKYAIPPPETNRVNIPAENNDNLDEMPPALMSDVEHAFVTSNDGKFFVIDRYRFMYREPPSKQKIPTLIAVLGQGEVPMTIEKRANGENVLHANFTCSMGQQKASKASIYILKDGEDTNSATHNPQTLFIVCNDLKYDNDVTIQPPLVLQSADRAFSVTVGSHLVGARNAPRMSWDGSIATYDVLNCLMPTEEDIDSGWLESYLNHHRNIGINTHIDIYNVNWHSTKLQSILNNFRVHNGRLVSRHDWSKRAKTKSFADNKFIESLSKPAAKMDCMLRSRGIDSYAMFGDINEMINKDAAGDLKICKGNGTDSMMQRCYIKIDVAPSELIKGGEASAVAIKNGKKECVNIKSVEIPPWTLV